MDVRDTSLALGIPDHPTKLPRSQGPPTNREQAERWLSARTLGPGVFNFAVREKSGNQVGTDIVGIMGSFHTPKCGYLIQSGERASQVLSAARSNMKKTEQAEAMPLKPSKHSYRHTSNEFRLPVKAASASTTLRAMSMSRTRPANGSLRSAGLPSASLFLASLRTS